MGCNGFDCSDDVRWYITGITAGLALVFLACECFLC